LFGMEDFWMLYLRGAGIALCLVLGVLILWKTRRWRDPALVWLLMGLSVGPVLVLVWNIVYRVWLTDVLAPTHRLTFGPLAGIQFHYVYDILNKVLDFGCALAVAFGITKLYSHARRRVTLVPPEKATTNDPRN